MRRRWVFEYLVVAAVAVMMALAVQAYVVKPFRIPSESMAATLVPRDRVLVNRVVYHLREPRRGDVVVVDSAVVGRVLIKRVVALPGETIELRDGVVLVDGRQIDEPYVRRAGDGPEPTLPFVGTGDAWSLEEPYVVPLGHYFLMGDHRSVSDDSRDWGPAPAHELIGEAVCTYWPLTRLRGL